MMENALFESHFDLIPFGIYVVDAADYTLIYSNLSFRERFGDYRGAVCHRALAERESPCPWCRLDALLTPEGLPNGRTEIFEHFNEVDDCWYQMQVRAMTWPDGRTVRYAVAVDISELKDTQNRLAEAHAELALRNLELTRLSTTDILTGLASRQHIEETTRQALADQAAGGPPLSLILYDIDLFKRINDRHGHLAGDMVLRALSELIGRRVPSGHPVGRWGGEEFLVVCPGATLAETYVAAESLRKAVRELSLPEVGGITCSFGVAQARPGDSLESLLDRADQALYAAKRLGRDRVEML